MNEILEEVREANGKLMRDSTAIFIGTVLM